MTKTEWITKDLREYKESLRDNIEEMEEGEYHVVWALCDWRKEVHDCTHIIKLIKKTKSLADLKQEVLAYRDDHPQVCNYVINKINLDKWVRRVI